eukprot:Gb_34109 [translate_table: standard]
MEAPADAGSIITVNGSKVGKLTSYAVGRSDFRHVGLGYVRRQVGLPGQEVKIGDIHGVLVDVPFVSRSLPTKIQMAKK